MEEPTPVREVREWRCKMVAGWKGKSWDEIQRELNEAGDRFREELAARRARQQPAERSIQPADGSEQEGSAD